jgi:hypothetical protein
MLLGLYSRLRASSTRAKDAGFVPLTFADKIERKLCEMADARHRFAGVFDAPDDIDDTAPILKISYQTTAAEAPLRTPAAPAQA